MDGDETDHEIEEVDENERNIAGKFHSGFISGWENDNEGIEEEKFPHDTPQKEILWAAENGDVDLVQQLLTKDPNLMKVTDNDGYTPLHRAAYNNHLNVLNVLLEHGADYNAETKDKWTPLHSACHWNSAVCADKLMSLGVDVNVQSQGGSFSPRLNISTGITPLHLAAGNNSSLATIQALLLHADINTSIKNNSNETAYEIAVRSGKLGRFFEAAEHCFNFL